MGDKGPGLPGFHLADLCSSTIVLDSEHPVLPSEHDLEIWASSALSMDCVIILQCMGEGARNKGREKTGSLHWTYRSILWLFILTYLLYN